MSVDLGSQFMKIAIVKVASYILHLNLLQRYMYLGLIVWYINMEFLNFSLVYLWKLPLISK